MPLDAAISGIVLCAITHLDMAFDSPVMEV